jgi:hypothetical protein
VNRYCVECGDQFHWDESTGDGVFCSWDCSEGYTLREPDYDLSVGPTPVPRLSEIRGMEFLQRLNDQPRP